MKNVVNINCEQKFLTKMFWKQKFCTQIVNKYFSYSCYQIFNDILLTKDINKSRNKNQGKILPQKNVNKSCRQTGQQNMIRKYC